MKKIKATKPASESATDKFFTTKQVAKLLKLSSHTVASWRRRAGAGPPFYHVVGTVRYDAAAFKKWKAEGS